MVDYSIQPNGSFNSVEYPKASPQHRLGGYFLEMALAIVTFGIGWLIWSLVLWGRGQTPAKQILKMRVMDVKSSRPASWGQMAIRQVLLPIVPGVLTWISFGAWFIRNGSDYPNVVPAGSYLISLCLLYLLVFAYFVTDSLWLLRADRRRLTDFWASTFVVNEAATVHNLANRPSSTL